MFYGIVCRIFYCGHADLNKLMLRKAQFIFLGPHTEAPKYKGAFRCFGLEIWRFGPLHQNLFNGIYLKLCSIILIYQSWGEGGPSKSWGGAIITTGLNKYFPTDFWLFLYIYQLCYISGPPMQKELSLASKLCI